MKKITKKKKKNLPKKNTSLHSSKTKGKKERRKWWKKLLSFLLVCCCIGIFAVFAFCIYIVSSCGQFDPNALANQDQTIIYDKDNNVIGKLGMEKRESVKYDKLPQVLIDAIVATEDSRFFQHNGVDGARFLKASVGQVLGNSSAGGASTLTMQVVKNNLTSTERNGIEGIIRKFKDVYISVFFMEKKYTKEEIMEFYVNDSLLGGNVYGVEEASKYYFGKSVSQLSLPEAAIIAGLFQSPNGDNPYKNPDRTKKRMNTVLKLMVRHGYITQKEADIASSIDIPSLLVGTSEANNYQGFIDTVVSEVKKKTNQDPALVSMEIHTTMDASIQNGINKILAGEGYKWKDDKVQAGITIVDVKTGAISAIGAGRNRTGERQWNFATQEKRQPGSTAKPIFAYAPGFEYDNFSTYQLFNDEAWKYTDGTPFNNWDSGYKGLMTLREALSISRNVPAVKAFQTVQKDVGNKKIVNFVTGLGIPLKDNAAYESYAIGGLDPGVTTTQMAGAYAAFANGGYYTEPYTVKSITYRSNGKTTEFENKKTQAMKDSTAYLITNVLEYAAHYGFSGGTGSYRGTVAAKTGTSNFDEATMKAKKLPASAVNDLWTVAYTPQYSIALWYGYEFKEISSQYYNSAGTPKDNLMSAIMKNIPVTNEKFNQPSSVVQAQVEAESWPAAKPSQYTPEALIKTEYFISGTEPTEESKRFAKLDDVTNLKITSTGNTVKLTWEHKTPDVVSQEYLNKYFSQSVFGNGTSQFLQERLSYNNDILGGLGYGIYAKTANGLNFVAFTTDKSYTYHGNNSSVSSLVVKVEYRNFKNNASNGVSTNVSIKGNSTDNDTTSSDLKISLNGGNKTMTQGNYVEDGIKVTYKGKEVKPNISYSVNGNTYTSITSLETAINSITEATTIKITYNISYKTSEGETITKSATRTVTIE